MPDRRVFALAPFALIACATAPAPPLVPPIAAAPIAADREPAPAPAVDAQAELAAKVDPIFSTFTKESPSPGCAVGIYRAGTIVFSKGYGEADLEHDAPITDTTPFYTASLSKQFTAAAVLLLAAEGKVSLDDDVRKYVPELPDYGQRITLEQLLHHTSGLRDYHLLLLLEGLNEEDVITSREVLWLLGHQRALNFSPGSHFSYTSSGYVLLAEVVARVSGESFHAFLTRRVLAPLGMGASLVREDHARLIPHRALGYTRGADGQPRMLMGNLEYDGSSNFVTTVRDLARWDANFYDPQVGGQAWVDAMRVRGKLTDGTVLDYAMGLEEVESHGLHVEEHDGSFAGYRTFLARYPAERLTVSVLCNTTEADADGLGEKVSAVLLPQLAAPEPSAAPVAPATFGFDLATVAGTYVDRSTAETRTVDETGGVLLMRYSHSKPRELVVAGLGDLLVKGSRSHYRYEPAKGKRPSQLLRMSTMSAPHTFVWVDPVDRPDALTDYAGRFGSDELAHDLEIRVENGHLVAAAVGGARRALLTRVAHDLFAGTGEADDVGWRFERDARGKVVRLVASTDRTREVALSRR